MMFKGVISKKDVRRVEIVIRDQMFFDCKIAPLSALRIYMHSMRTLKNAFFFQLDIMKKKLS